MANLTAPLLQATTAASYRTAGILWLNSATGTQRRLMVYEIEPGQTGSLASTDIQLQWDVSRFSATTAAVGSALVPNLTDPADSSPISQYMNNLTTELTYTTAGFGLSLKNWGFNQRGMIRWRALDDGDNLIIPAVAWAGIGVRMLAPPGLIAAMSAVGGLSYIER